MAAEIRQRAAWPWPAHDVEAAAQNALRNVWSLPKGPVVDMSAGLDWAMAFGAAGNSTLLWLHSLPFVHDLLEMHVRTGDDAYWTHGRGLLLDYLAWLGASDANRARGWRDEHAVANRSFVLADMALASEADGSEAGDHKLRRVLRDAVRAHAEWLADDRHYVFNNHGTMMDRALLQLSVLPAGMGGVGRDAWRAVALRRLRHMIAATFDADGCCVENSPAYHLFNVLLFREIARFLDAHGAAADAASLRSILDKADAVTPLFMRPDGSLPLIGDTERDAHHAVRRPRPDEALGHAVFPGAGFAILNGEMLRVTAKCGGASFSHRHIDETSITVRCGDKDIIVDGGLYNYDIGDRMRRWFISHRAHSGFFTASCEGVRFARFPDATALGSITAVSGDDGRSFVAMRSRLVEGVAIHRDLLFAAPDCLVIADRMRAGAPERWGQRFLLHPACAVAIDGPRATITRDGVACEIEQLASGAGAAWGLEPSWYSERFMQADPTRCLVYKGEASAVSLVTTLRFRLDEGAGRDAA